LLLAEPRDQVFGPRRIEREPRFTLPLRRVLASPLAEFELLVLLAALRLGPDEAYTVSIAEAIQQRTGRSVRRANVYTTLQRLEAKRLIDTRLGDPRAERGGKPRRLVTLRPSGVKAVRATTTAIQAMVGDLDGAIGEPA
jgi:PadR family transcriptional regulator PadR